MSDQIADGDGFLTFKTIMTPESIIETLTHSETLALTIYGEARGEPIDGQVAVASVIRNRYESHKDKYDGFKQICLEPRQFSCWNKKDPNYQLLLESAKQMILGQIVSDKYLKQCIWVATGITDQVLLDNTRGARNYLTRKLFEDARPVWARKLSGLAIYRGTQVFFNVA